jgi:dinuclear metal center YbgI/SA1388 family protein
MKAVVDLLIWLNHFAPSRLAEPWDNVGLLWGDPGSLIEKVMTCLTLTPDIADEAIAEGAGLIVSHHPVLFKPVKSITFRAGDRQASFLWKLARANVAIASPHTALDNTVGGINDHLAAMLGLQDVGPLKPSSGPPRCKIVVFTPESDREAVMSAAFAARAGQIGEYRECSYRSAGSGTFLGGESTDPAVGRKGVREQVDEWRLEFVADEADAPLVVDAIRRAHSYEEPAIDVYPLRGTPAGPGVGRIGRLSAPEPLETFARRVAMTLNAPATQFVGDPKRPIERVAIACGAGDDFLRDVAWKADVLLTGEARFHRAFEAESLNVALIVAGHHATERPGVEMLAGRIAQTFPDLTVWASRREVDPFQGILNDSPEVAGRAPSPESLF